MNSKVLKIYPIIILLLVVVSCAKVMSPSGGPKDFDPPKVILESPKCKTINFIDNKVKIYFDEYVKLKNQQEELIIVPSLKNKPKVTVKGKKIIIKFMDTLPKNRTISFNFYNSLVDVNEENLLKDFRYYFSTGTKLDTNFIDGKLVDAFSGKPLARALVFVYKNFSDSVVSLQEPYSIGRTDKNGIFVVHSLDDGPYKLFAILDKNRNMLYDQPTEPVAFTSDSIYPKIEWTKVQDTLHIVDSISVENNDTIFRDSVIFHDALVSSLKPFHLNMFVKEYKKHFLKSTDRLRQGLLNITFNKAVDSSMWNFKILNPSSNNNIIKQYITNDSIMLWITDTAVAHRDTIQMQITYPYSDSLNKVISKIDTVLFKYDNKKLKKADTSLIVLNNLRSGNLDIDSLFAFNFSSPIKYIDSSKISILQMLDSVYDTIDYNHIINSIVDIFENTNDSIAKAFEYFAPEDYGNIILNLDTISSTFIVQLLTDKNMVVLSRSNIDTKNIQFKLVVPGKYQIKIIIDKNSNGKWDTGDYYKHLQPEKVIAFPTKITAKKNWDSEFNWNIKELINY